MPADADLLCEYYIASNLNSKKNKSGLKTKSISETSLSNASANSLLYNESAAVIDFVKYDKNPMDYLKKKYQLLNNTGQIQKSQSLSNLNTSSVVSDKMDLEWSKIRRNGTGLLNLGNNCYLNATLQCLAYTPPLSQWLVTRAHSALCKFRQIKGFCSLCEVERIIYDIFNSNGCAKPNSLCYNIKKISAVFGVGTQEDASEFFTTLIESMAKSIKFSLNIPNKLSLMSKKKANTILDDIFSFQFCSRITCSNCDRTSDTVESTNTWPVDVKYAQDIRKGMLHFLREEVLDGQNAYKCDKCGKKTRATKKYTIRTAPNILVIHLKRFDFSHGGKLSHYVSYPETLNMKTFVPETGSMASNEKSLRKLNYKLYGVLVHLGYTSHSGHYFSYVRGPNDVWYKADDQRVSAVQARDALAQHAYILFYSKINDSAIEPSPKVPSSIEKNITMTCPKPRIYGPVLPNVIKAIEKKESKGKKDYERMTRKKLKRIIANIRKKIENDSKNAKLKRRLKIVKKVLKIKREKNGCEEKKRKVDDDETDSSIPGSSISSLSSASSSSSAKKFKSEHNGLTLLKQYKSSSSSISSLSVSPSPSPEPRLFPQKIKV
ncbi:Ubiquitin carboxyl-terminal hydrolase [Brachionus plicatilis]|uniref:Ubiquitin carboxyl-terminal hydrolase n=1 Tax=Brachionus plicatilis TaxID=10195 RepID=A0A3M7QQV7_BRAPC|nr:Ubiquitin carboxyl-terminal hydrolase [Brachionus plicatilis]